jgi:hypothetical protein
MRLSSCERELGDPSSFRSCFGWLHCPGPTPPALLTPSLVYLYTLSSVRSENGANFFFCQIKRKSETASHRTEGTLAGNLFGDEEGCLCFLQHDAHNTRSLFYKHTAYVCTYVNPIPEVWIGKSSQYDFKVDQRIFEIDEITTDVSL